MGLVDYMVEALLAQGNQALCHWPNDMDYLY